MEIKHSPAVGINFGHTAAVGVGADSFWIANTQRINFHAIYYKLFGSRTNGKFSAATFDVATTGIDIATRFGFLVVISHGLGSGSSHAQSQNQTFFHLQSQISVEHVYIVAGTDTPVNQPVAFLQHAPNVPNWPFPN